MLVIIINYSYNYYIFVHLFKYYADKLSFKISGLHAKFIWRTIQICSAANHWKGTFLTLTINLALAP